MNKESDTLKNAFPSQYEELMKFMAYKGVAEKFVSIMEEDKDGSITIEQQVSDLYYTCKKLGV